MKVSTILDHIDSGHMALPEFQRGYVWNRDQVRALMDSLYRRHPVGSLLVWATSSEGAEHRGDVALAPGTVKLLLDGQQRMTSLYGIVRGKAPRFFDGNADSFTGLRFHLRRQEFMFYQPITMKDDPLWIGVSELMRAGPDGLGMHLARLSADPSSASEVGTAAGRLSQLLGIREIDFHVEEVTGEDKSIDVVVDIFNRVNSGGTKLSKGDLALAKICADWPQGRAEMKAMLARWQESDFHFQMDWLLRSVNAVVTGEAKFNHLHNIDSERIREGLTRTERGIDYMVNLIAGRLGLDHDRVFFGRYTMPVLVHYLDRRNGRIEDTVDRDKLLYWYLHCALWGRYSGSTESIIDQDLKHIETLDGGLDRLIDELRLWHGSLRVVPQHFGGYGRGARFYPMLYLLTRVGQALDWGTGIELKNHMLGKMSKLEVHHIFPKALLKKHGYRQTERNAVANFCFQTKDTNLQIGAKPPEEYFPEIEKRHPGALSSQWIPMDPSLWTVEMYPTFLEARRELLSKAANDFLDRLFHSEATEESAPSAVLEGAQRHEPAQASLATSIPGGVESDEEERQLLELNAWVVAQGLPEGQMLYEVSDLSTGQPLAVLDLCWPEGLQEGLSRAVAVLLNEGEETLSVANTNGFRYFTSVDDFKEHVRTDVLARP